MYEIRTSKAVLGHAKTRASAIMRARSAAKWRKRQVKVLVGGKLAAICKRHKVKGKSVVRCHYYGGGLTKRRKLRSGLVLVLRARNRRK